MQGDSLPQARGFFESMLKGSKRLTTICDQQGDAIAAGREIARNQHSELRIQGREALTPNPSPIRWARVAIKPGATATIRSRRAVEIVLRHRVRKHARHRTANRLAHRLFQSPVDEVELR